LFSLSEKTAIVTGGTSGIDRVVANYLASAGANVAIVSTRLDVSSKVADEIAAEYHVQTVGIGCDVTDEAAVDKMVEKVANTIGTANVLFNNAGININGSALELNYADWKRVLDVNVNGVFLVARAFARRLITEKKPGSIINTASISASIVNLPQAETPYNTSKGAVVHLTKTQNAGCRMGQIWDTCQYGEPGICVDRDESSPSAGYPGLLDQCHTIWPFCISGRNCRSGYLFCQRGIKLYSRK